MLLNVYYYAIYYESYIYYMDVLFFLQKDFPAFFSWGQRPVWNLLDNKKSPALTGTLK